MLYLASLLVELRGFSLEETYGEMQNCGNPMPKGMQVHDECVEELTVYLSQEQLERDLFEALLGDIQIDL
jgi:hypothetical protein